MGFSIADVSCNYQDILEITRTFTEDKPLYAGGNYILADTNKPATVNGTIRIWIWNHDTSCSTSFEALEKCGWDFYRFTDNHGH